MQLLINDETSSVPVSPHQTLRELAQMICPADAPDRCLVVAVRCDGQDLADEQLDSLLDTPATQFTEVAFQTQRMRALIAQSLAQAIELFRQADANRQEAADLITRAQQQSAMGKLLQLFSDWQQVQQTAQLCAQGLNLSLAEIKVDGIDAVQAVDQIKSQLTNLKAALQANDLVLVADILRFELDSPFAEWSQILSALHTQAQKR